MRIRPGSMIEGKYRVLRVIGEGGMGTVFEGQNIRIDRRVAIKVLHEHVASSPEFSQRFEREARTSAQIDSPYVCDVLDFGHLDNGQRFIVMEYLEGESLEERLCRGKMTPEEIAPIAFELLEGLGTMHQAGIIHRDLKPANIFLVRRAGTSTETVKILDFGVAKILAEANAPNQMTSTGMMMGTPLYMSPEQARGARDVDCRTDLYAASVIFYRALTGTMPHLGANVQELLFKIVLEDPLPILEAAPEVDEVFAAIVAKGLERDPDQRYASARAYQQEIAMWGHAKRRANFPLNGTLALGKGALDGPSSMNQPGRVERTGPPTPGAAAKPGHNTPATRPSGGTPLGWSGAVNSVRPESGPSYGSQAPWAVPKPLGRTPAQEPSVLSNLSASHLDPGVPVRSRAKTHAVIGIGALVLIAGAVVGLNVMVERTTTVANAPVGTTSVMFDKRELATPPPTVDAPSPSATSSSTLAVPVAAMSSSVAAKPVPPPPAPRRFTFPSFGRTHQPVLPVTSEPVTRATPVPQDPIPSPPVTTTTTTTKSPASNSSPASVTATSTATTGRRKFRTNIE